MTTTDTLAREVLELRQTLVAERAEHERQRRAWKANVGELKSRCARLAESAQVWRNHAETLFGGLLGRTQQRADQP